MRRVLPADVVAEAEAELWCDGMSIDRHPEPEVMQEEARLEAQARFWGWSRLSPEQHNQYRRLAGQCIYADLADAMADPQWEELDDEERLKWVDGIKSDARAAARDELGLGSAMPAGWETIPPGWEVVK